MTQFNDAFWRWFGDSKVVDGKGNPLVVYHGTGEAGISVFKTGTGAWFSTDSDLAAAYSGSRSWEGGAPTLYSVYLRMTRPLKINAESRLKTTREELAAAVGFAWSRSKKIDRTTGWPVDWRYVKVFQFVHTPEFVRAAANEGYDGIIMPEGRALTFGVFSPTQIKSATGNDGTWDADDPDITSNPPGSKKIGRATLEYGHIASDRMLPVLVFEGKKYGPDDIIDGFPAGSVVVTIISGQKSMSNETLRAAKKFVGQSLQHGLRWLEAIEGWEGAPQEDDPANWDAGDLDVYLNPPARLSQKRMQALAAQLNAEAQNGMDGFLTVTGELRAHRDPSYAEVRLPIGPHWTADEVRRAIWEIEALRARDEATNPWIDDEVPPEGEYRVGELWTDGNSIFEFGYDPSGEPHDA